MFGFRTSVSEDMRHWISESFDWFDQRFEPPKAPIVPSKEFFKAPAGTSEVTAKLVLEDVKKHLLLDQDIEIAPLDVLSAEYRIDYNATSAVAGTFQNNDGVLIIRYDPEQMNRPLQFINLIAHELMHARLDGLIDQVPGGAGAHELATDLGCIIAGYGVFQLQAADDAGWNGYMTQPTRAHALALFLARRALGPETVAPFLSSRCKKHLQRAIKDL